MLYADRRLPSRFTVALVGTEPEALGHLLSGASGAVITAVARHLGDTGNEPTGRTRTPRQAAGARYARW